MATTDTTLVIKYSNGSSFTAMINDEELQGILNVIYSPAAQAMLGLKPEGAAPAPPLPPTLSDQLADLGED